MWPNHPGPPLSPRPSNLRVPIQGDNFHLSTRTGIQHVQQQGNRRDGIGHRISSPQISQKERFSSQNRRGPSFPPLHPTQPLHSQCLQGPGKKPVWSRCAISRFASKAVLWFSRHRHMPVVSHSHPRYYPLCKNVLTWRCLFHLSIRLFRFDARSLPRYLIPAQIWRSGGMDGGRRSASSPARPRASSLR